MRPSEPSIREELRREAAQVRIPTDMWEQISRRMDQEDTLAEARRRRINSHEKWKPFFAFAAAAGVFWLTVVPLGTPTESGQNTVHAVNNSLVMTIESDTWGSRQAQALQYRTESSSDSSGVDGLQPGSQRILRMNPSDK